VKKQPLWVAGAVVAAVGLVLLATYFGWHGFNLEHKIDPILLATLAVTAYIAYYLQYYFVSKVAADGSEKEILLDSLRDLISTLRSIRDALMTCHDAGGRVSATNAKSITRLLRQLSNGLESFESTIGMSHCATLQPECKPIRDAIYSYKSSATGGNFPTRPYDVNAVVDQERAFRTLSTKLHELVFKITRFR
jgi:hypothetical protein